MNLAPAWNELVGTLYDPEERAKIEWSFGAVLTGHAARIQKFLVLHGPAASGKSTVLNIAQKLFDDSAVIFDVKSLRDDRFGALPFRENPQVAIQHDVDISDLNDTPLFMSIVSREAIIVKAKFQNDSVVNINTFVMMSTNKPLDCKSVGLIRRMIDVRSESTKVSAARYRQLISEINFELRGIADHCTRVFNEMGKDYYKFYQPAIFVG